MNDVATKAPPPSDKVRLYVRALLEEADAFKSLPREERTKLAGDFARVMAYLTDPNAGLGPSISQPALATALDDPGTNDALKRRLAKQQNLVGKDFKAGAATEGAKTFERLVKAVDFPKFVSSLIEGVYTSIVNSSIKQMQAYGKLLEAVVKSVEDFAQDNVTDDQACDFIAAAFPHAVSVDRSSGETHVRLRDDVDDKDVPDFQKALQMEKNVALDEDNEAQIVLAAKLKMARQRQQQLATMVMLGINRIIVTDGEIKASVLFDVKARDTAERETQASTSDTTSHESRSGGGWWDSGETVDTSVSSAYSEEKEKSTADLDARAKLSGSVTVRFKSETFPLEKMATSGEIGAIQGKSAR
jgi:hypothetical protein